MLGHAPQIYARHFTIDELKQLYTFQSSPLGKKSLKVMPQILGELMPIILKQSKKVGRRILKRLKNVIRDKGYKI